MTAIPDSAMNPIAAEIERGMPREARAMIPPTQANGTFMKMMSGGRAFRKAAKRTARINTMTTGTTRASRRDAA